MIGDLPPFAIFYLGAFLAFVTSGWTRRAVLLATPAVSFWGFVSALETPRTLVLSLGGGGTPALELFQLDALSLSFACIFHVAAILGVVFALHVEDRVQHAMSLVYAGSALAAVLAGDLLTIFFAWELMALASVFLVWAARTPRAARAGTRYLLVQLVSGLAFLGGALVHFHARGTLAIESFDATSPGWWPIFVAVGVKAAFPGLHGWLIDAYPEATPTGTVWLASFTTKTAIYLLARLFPGTELLVPIGAVMTMFPIFYAVIENDLRRVLGYSVINQLGFMVVGIGIGSNLAVNGAVAHAFCDILFKGLLFMSMGAVLERTGKIGASELGGLYRSMPWTTLFCIIGAAAISAVPFFSAFASKSMIVSAAGAEGRVWLWLVLLFAAAGVLHHAGIKIPYFAFFAKDSGARPREASWNMLVAMGVSAFLCIALGVVPHLLLYRLMPYPVEYQPFDVTHILTQVQLLWFSALAFVVLHLIHKHPPELPGLNIDADWLYRRAGRCALWVARIPLARGLGGIGQRLEGALAAIAARAWATPEAPVSPPGRTRKATPRLGFEPEVKVPRVAFERLPVGLPIALSTLAFFVVLFLLL